MRIELRPMVEEDLPLLHGGDSPFDDFGPQPLRPEPSSPRLEEQGGLTVYDADTDEVLGMVSWHWVAWGPNPGSRNPNIGIWLRRDARGRGVGAQAQRQLVDLIFRHTTVNRVDAHTDVTNLAEQRALERAGFTSEGIVRGGQWRDGAYHDGHLYAILRSEWAAAQPARSTD